MEGDCDGSDVADGVANTDVIGDCVGRGTCGALDDVEVGVDNC